MKMASIVELSSARISMLWNVPHCNAQILLLYLILTLSFNYERFSTNPRIF